MKYDKVARPDADLLARWQEKGLHVPNPDDALRALTFVGYFRLRGYALPLMRSMPNGGRVFKAGVSFPDILARHDFDRDLRNITLEWLGRIEVAVRTVISNQMSQQYGAFWYLKHPQQVLAHATGRGNRPEAFAIGRFLSSVERDTRHSSDLFARHYFEKYDEPLLPPSWLMAECVSFGTWSRLYKHLQKSGPARPNPKKEIAKIFGLSVSLVESWLHALALLRNTCAHHGRVWNRRFAYRPEIYAQARHHFADQQSYYCLAVVMRLFSRVMDTEDGWPVRLMDLFKKHPRIGSEALGFPQDWERDPLWG